MPYRKILVNLLVTSVVFPIFLSMRWLVILFFATNLLTLPLYKNIIYLAYALPFGGFFAGLLYVLIDRYEERVTESIHAFSEQSFFKD